MKQKITIGLKHYTGAACTFGFSDSVAVVEVPTSVEGLAMHKRNLERLKALFSGTVVEDVDGAVKAPENAPNQAGGAAVAEAAPEIKLPAATGDVIAPPAPEQGPRRRRG